MPPFSSSSRTCIVRSAPAHISSIMNWHTALQCTSPRMTIPMYVNVQWTFLIDECLLSFAEMPDGNFYLLMYVHGSWCMYILAECCFVYSHRFERHISRLLRMYISFPWYIHVLLNRFIQSFLCLERMHSGTIIELYSQPCCPPFSWVPSTSPHIKLAVDSVQAVAVGSIVVDVVTANASHGLRQPLTIIRTYSLHFHSYDRRDQRHPRLLPDLARCPSFHNIYSLVCFSTRLVAGHEQKPEAWADWYSSQDSSPSRSYVPYRAGGWSTALCTMSWWSIIYFTIHVLCVS
jgi:hypothetical protein